MEITLATCQKQPGLTPSDRLLAEALGIRGAMVHAAPWDTITPGTRGAATVCLRSTWDYHRRAGEFRQWVSHFCEAPGSLWNPPETVLWNLDKAYLRQLEALGVAIPPTRWIEPGQIVDLPRLLAEQGWRRAVLKPRVSATAYGTHLVTPATALTMDEWVPLRTSGALLQQFVPEIADRGEVSLVFVDGIFSHAARKLPAAGEFRVQHDFGGSAERIEAPPEIRSFGRSVLAALPLVWLYARVDVVEAENGALLMELELIEPDLFLNLAPDRAGSLADALLAKASRNTA